VAWFFPFFHGLLIGCAAMILHESAHLLCALAQGIKVKRVGITWNKGLNTVREAGSPARNMLIALAGPLMNILLVSFWYGSPTFGLANFCYALANLLPIDGSDGSRIVNCWMQMRKKQSSSDSNLSQTVRRYKCLSCFKIRPLHRLGHSLRVGSYKLYFLTTVVQSHRDATSATVRELGET
jgi:Zn-dependent protease